MQPQVAAANKANVQERAGQWKKSQWLLTTMAVDLARSNVKDLPDVSPERHRFEAYEARAAGPQAIAAFVRFLVTHLLKISKGNTHRWTRPLARDVSSCWRPGSQRYVPLFLSWLIVKESIPKAVRNCVFD
jgi:hypothetical protein